MENTETINATTIPKSRIKISAPVKWNPNFTIFNRLAPNITGIPRKKENSAAAGLEQPMIMAPKIVEPDLEVPGTRESTWNKPIIKAVL